MKKLTLTSRPAADTLPVYVLAASGLVYKDPVVGGDDWQLLFDPAGGPALLCVVPAGVRDRAAWARRFVALKLGLAARVVGGYALDSADGRPLWRFALQLAGPPPEGLFAGAGYWQPSPPCYLFDWGKNWG